MTRAGIVVAGAGPAGLAAAIAAARRGRDVVLLDRASRPGVKILISGGNRCNLTHDCDAAALAPAFGRAGARFLGHALRMLGPRELRSWIESLGVPTKVEPGGKVFPVSDRAVDVRDALEAELARAGVRFVGGAEVRAVRRDEERIGEARGGFVVETSCGTFAAPRVVLALGGRSYPKVGTRGDGEALARALGHSIVASTPALVPLVVGAAWVRELAGVTLEDVELSLAETGGAADGGRASDARGGGRGTTGVRGALLFTHFGLSGPAPMNLGGAVAQRLAQREAAAARDAVPERDAAVPPVPVAIAIDFLPARARAEIDARLVAAGAGGDRRLAKTWVAELLPRRLADALVAAAGIDAATPLAQLGAAARRRLLDQLFSTRVEVAATRGFDFAEVTRGGVALAEVDPATLESRLVPGLFLCGELLDLDGPIGGYNFTAAFATGTLAGLHAAAPAGPQA